MSVYMEGVWKVIIYQMQWEFRKALESFEGYKRTTSFKNEIENGDDNTLDMVAREVELILSDKAEKIIPKVLALRVTLSSCSLSGTSWYWDRRISSKDVKNWCRSSPRSAPTSSTLLIPTAEKPTSTTTQVCLSPSSLHQADRLGGEEADRYTGIYLPHPQS